MKRRLLYSYLSITAFVFLVVAVPFGVSSANAVERRLASDMQHDAFSLAIRTQEVVETVESSSASRAELQTIVDEYHADAGGSVVIVDRDGIGLAGTRRAGASPRGRDYSDRPEIVDAIGGAESSGIVSSRDGRGNQLYVVLPVGAVSGVQGAVRITYPASVVGDRILRSWLLLAAIGGVVLGIVFLVSLLLARSVTKPLGDLESAAGALGAGDLTVRAAVPRGPGEIRGLAESFNATAARLEQLVGTQRAFIADASHQLRTPLAAMRLRLENLEADVSGHAAEDLEGAPAEVRRLSRLVDGLLALTRAEQSTSAPVSLPVEELLAGRVDAWEAFAAERQVRIDTVSSSGLAVRATPGRLEQVVDNLLNNALEVAPEGSTVHLEARGRGSWVELHVSDEGPGMSEVDRARAFDRFWQSASARVDMEGAKEHFGLGLAIVHELVAADGGHVRLDAALSGGLEVVVRMRRGDPVEIEPPARQLSTTSG